MKAAELLIAVRPVPTLQATRTNGRLDIRLLDTDEPMAQTGRRVGVLLALRRPELPLTRRMESVASHGIEVVVTRLTAPPTVPRLQVGVGLERSHRVIPTMEAGAKPVPIQEGRRAVPPRFAAGGLERTLAMVGVVEEGGLTTHGPTERITTPKVVGGLVGAVARQVQEPALVLGAPGVPRPPVLERGTTPERLRPPAVSLRARVSIAVVAPYAVEKLGRQKHLPRLPTSTPKQPEERVPTRRQGGVAKRLRTAQAPTLPSTGPSRPSAPSAFGQSFARATEKTAGPAQQPSSALSTMLPVWAGRLREAA